MIRIFNILIFVFFSIRVFSQVTPEFINKCADDSGDDATYLKDFPVQLDATQPNQPQPVARFPLVLSKNNIYRFSVCTPPESHGKAVLKLYDSNTLIFSSYNKDSGEEFNPFNFFCQKTGIYHVFISFDEGKEGEAVGVLSNFFSRRRIARPIRK